uniref:Uncharacterized protein n=1 Tax=Arundo donax TaxID=35708 RepID=A0A0A9GWB8_ARUDO
MVGWVRSVGPNWSVVPGKTGCATGDASRSGQGARLVLTRLRMESRWPAALCRAHALDRDGRKANAGRRRVL